MRPELAVHPEQEEGEADGRHGQENAHRDRRRSPDHDRDPVDRHAGRPTPQEGDDEVRRADRRGYAEEDHAEGIEIHVRAGIEVLQRIGRVVEPAIIRRRADQEAGIHEQAGGQIHPVGEGVQPRKRHVPRAEEQREQIVREARQDRQGIEEDHRDAVHREQLVVLFRGHHALLGPGELNPHDQCLDAARDEEGEGRDDVADADFLVIDGANPAHQAGIRLPDRLEPGFQFRGRDARLRDLLMRLCHGSPLSPASRDRCGWRAVRGLKFPYRACGCPA